MYVCVQGRTGEPSGEDEYVEGGANFRVIHGGQEVGGVCVF